MDSRKLLQLYQSLVRSTIEYACPVWQIIAQDCLKPLENIQRKGLSMCLNLPSTSGREALEVESGVLPVDLRFQEISVREVAKIQSKALHEPIKQLLERIEDEEVYDRFESPLGKAINQAVDMKKETGIDIQLVEPEYQFIAGSDTLVQDRPSYWNRLGSSKSRTEEQKALGKEVIQEILGETTDSTIVAFTDGSCEGNPGPSGAGAVLFPGDTVAVELKKPVSSRGAILLAELVAIVMVLEYCITHLKDTVYNHLHILSDSQTAVGILTLNWKSTNYRDVITEIKEYMLILSTLGITTTIQWTPGHASIEGNEIADRLAKEAAGIKNDRK